MTANQETGLAELAAQRRQQGFALVDSGLRIVEHDTNFCTWCQAGMQDVVGQPLTELFVELIGLELSLVDIIDGRRRVLTIPTVHRLTPSGQDRYFDLVLERIELPQAAILVTVRDVTEQSQQRQQLQQKRNELDLLSAQLEQANSQLAYLLKHFVPERVAQQLIHARDLPRPGGRLQREATLLFADMRNFTALAEAYDSERVLDILNSYLAVVAQPILEQDGSLVQIVGDMLMASFNVPDAQSDHVLRAIRAALAIQTRLATYIASERPADVPILGFGIGIATGPVTAGYLGVQERYRYAVFGDTTNVAFHLCSRAKAGQIIISPLTLEPVADRVRVTELGEVSLKQRRQALATYELHSLREHGPL